MRFLEIVELSLEEIEAIRLKNIENLDQIECAKLMHTSQSTFQRILSSAYAKVSKALIEGRAIKIINNSEQNNFKGGSDGHIRAKRSGRDHDHAPHRGQSTNL